jgi:hypothetical protein
MGASADRFERGPGFNLTVIADAAGKPRVKPAGVVCDGYRVIFGSVRR